MKLTTIQKAYLALITANIIWGAASPIFKWSLTNIPPFTLAFWRFFIGAAILFVILRNKAKLPTSNRKDLWSLIFFALSGITVNIIFFFWGLRLTYAINAPVIASAQPILTLFFAMLFLQEKFRPKKFLGMLVGVFGILAIVLEPMLEAGIGGSILGNSFLVVAALAAVVQTIIGKRLLKRFNALSVTFWAFIIGSASFLPLAIYEYLSNAHLYTSLDVRGITGIIFGAFLSSAAAYTLFAWGLSKIPATDASLFTYIDPIAGSLLAYFMLNEPFTKPFILGSILIFIGILIAEGHIHYHPILKLRSPKKFIEPLQTVSASVNQKEALRRIFKH